MMDMMDGMDGMDKVERVDEVDGLKITTPPAEVLFRALMAAGEADERLVTYGPIQHRGNGHYMITFNGWVECRNALDRHVQASGKVAETEARRWLELRLKELAREPKKAAKAALEGAGYRVRSITALWVVDDTLTPCFEGGRVTRETRTQQWVATKPEGQRLVALDSPRKSA